MSLMARLRLRFAERLSSGATRLFRTFRAIVVVAGALWIGAQGLVATARAAPAGPAEGRASARAALSRLEELEDMANFLRVLIDRNVEKPTRVYCRLVSSEAKLLIHALKSRLDEHLAAQGEVMRKAADPRKIARSCASGCRCGAYVTLFGDEAKGATLERIRAAAARQTDAQARTCAFRESPRICRSALLAELRAELQAQSR